MDGIRPRLARASALPAALASLALASLSLAGCENPLRDQVKQVIAESEYKPAISVSFVGIEQPSGSSIILQAAPSGSDPVDMACAIKNVGQLPLELIGSELVAIEGSGDFTIPQQPVSPIPPGDSTSFTLRFQSHSDAEKAATLKIATNDPKLAIYSLSVQSGAAYPSMSLHLGGAMGTPIDLGDYPSIDFGDVLVGTPADIRLTVVNDGFKDLSVSSLAFSGYEGSDTGFSFESALPGVVARKGGSASVLLRYWCSTIVGTVKFSISSDDASHPSLSLAVSRGCVATMPAPVARVDSNPTPDSASFLQKRKEAAWDSSQFPDSGGSRFTVDGLIVVDHLTGLEWERVPVTSYYTWADAFAHARSLTLNGFSDWRLPNVFELESLVNYAASSVANWLENGDTVFMAIQPDFYWTSSGSPEYSITARVQTVNLGTGEHGTSSALSGATHYAIAVRQGAGGRKVALPATDYRSPAGVDTLEDAVVRSGLAWDDSSRYSVVYETDDGEQECAYVDRLTGLVWMQCKADGQVAYAAAEALAAGYNDSRPAGIGTWRLPTIRELIGVSALVAGYSTNYWTSTADAAAAGRHWTKLSYNRTATAVDSTPAGVILVSAGK